MNGRDGGGRKLTLDFFKEANMSAFDALFMWTAAISFAAAGDHFWVSQIRPILARWFGWPPLDPEKMIPPWAWVGCLIVLAVLFIFVPFVGAAAGY